MVSILLVKCFAKLVVHRCVSTAKGLKAEHGRALLWDIWAGSSVIMKE